MFRPLTTASAVRCAQWETTAKFEILKLLSEGPKYGMELASLLELSTATVSHHMALLLEAGFVSIRRESNRVYYELNRKKLRDFLDELRSSLLGQ